MSETEDPPVKLTDEEYQEMLGHACPDCGSTNRYTRWAPETFTYGQGDDAQQLTISLPVRCCSDCPGETLDHASEVIQDTLVRIYCRDRVFQPKLGREPE